MNPWLLPQTRCVRGGPLVVPHEYAPVGTYLPYRRAGGEHPPGGPTPLLDDVAAQGWRTDLGDRGLGDLLLGLAIAQGLREAADIAGEAIETIYEGPRASLLARCLLPVMVRRAAGPHIVRTASAAPVTFTAVPERPPTWLDTLDGQQTMVHAALPMRYYLELEQALGIRLPADLAPAPGFWSPIEAATPFHVVFVATTSWPRRKDYGASGFAAIADALVRHCAADWSFTTISAANADTARWPAFDHSPNRLLPGLDAVDCLDVFAIAELVIGNDTGLTQLAALCTRPDGSGPEVVSLYGRHAHTKWTTGSPRHHAVATRFSQMMATADACPVRDTIDDARWGPSADITALPPKLIASFAGHCAGWW